MKTITVKGVGTASTKPDYITISLNINAKSPEYANAVSNANLRIEMLQKAIGSVGFVKDDLKTLSFNVRSDYENYHDENGMFKHKFVGYVCDYNLKLAFDFDNERLSKTLDAISQSKAEAGLFISFTVKEPEKVSAELLRSATENARKKAEILCAASNTTLGELVSIDYNWSDICFNSVSAYSERERGIVPAAAAPEFTPDDIKSSDTATFVWEIK